MKIKETGHKLKKLGKVLMLTIIGFGPGLMFWLIGRGLEEVEE